MRLKIKNAMFTITTFYFVSAIAFFYSLTSDPNMLHIALIGVLSLITGLGVYKMRRWSLWLAFIVFCSGNVFALTMLLNTIITGGLTLQLALIAYLILIWMSTVYIAIKRNNFR